MDIKKIIVFAVLSGLLSLPLLTLAQPLEVLAAAPNNRVNNNVDVMEVLGNIVDWIFSILLVFAAIMIVVAAFYFVTAQGNPDQVTKARNFVLWALIGVLVAFLARGLVNFVGKIVE
ncbi:MAG TPA: hypothetical protein ENL33_00965 [Candidatus Parcubacteria bacterium]|nr:hypothetical protein [Candidatus Parcubacteria bacterium]